MAINPSIWYGDLPSHKRAAIRLAITATDLIRNGGGESHNPNTEIVVLLAKMLQINDDQAHDILHDPDTRVAALRDVLAGN